MDDSSEVFDIDMDTLVKLKNKACSETNFAVQAVFENLFLDEEIESKNLSRAKGKESLDPVRIEKGKQYFFKIYPCLEEEDRNKEWSKACEVFDSIII